MATIDFRSFSNGKTPPEQNKSGVDLRWWDRTGGELADSVSQTLLALDRAQAARISQLITAARLYGNLPMLGMTGMTYSRYGAIQNVMRERLTFNVIQSVIDTVTAKIAKNKPKPFFLTSGADYKTQRKAKRLNMFVEGLFYENDAYKLGELIFRDSCIWGDGLAHVFVDENGRIKFERVASSEMYVDEIEAFYGQPRQMHRVVNVDRHVLIDRFPGKKKLIVDANAAPMEDARAPNVADVVMVRESWHLPSSKGAKDGRHAITIAGETLLSEKWVYDFFPFARMQWCPKLYGYWSQGLAEQVQNIQMEINKVLWIVQRSYQLGGSFKVLVENGSKVVKSHLDNEVGSIITYTGRPPEYIVPPILPPEIYGHLEKLKQSAYEQAGISMLSAASKKPEGLDSGRALREMNDIESDRFVMVGHAYERFFLDLARIGIALAREEARESGSYDVNVPGRMALRKFDWKEIDLEEDSYVMQCFPVSSLPNQPEGRFQTVQEWVQAGWYTVRQAKKLMNFPDTEQIDSLQQAAEDVITEDLDKIVDEGIQTAPEALDNLEVAAELALEYYQIGKVNGLEDERLEMLRVYIQQVNALMNPPPPPGAPPPAPPMMAPPPPGALPPGPPQPQMAPPPSAPPAPGVQ
jgi:hypothetical protein